MRRWRGYTPPPDRPTTPPPPNVSSPNLGGVDSPQTIAQSARDGVPIAGRPPAPRDDRITQRRRRAAQRRRDVQRPRERRGAGAVLPVVGREGLHPGLGHELLAAGRSGSGLRAQRLLADRRDGPAVVAGHERPRARRRDRRHHGGPADGPHPDRCGRLRPAARATGRRSSRSRRPTARCRRSTCAWAGAVDRTAAAAARAASPGDAARGPVGLGARERARRGLRRVRDDRSPRPARARPRGQARARARRRGPRRRRAAVRGDRRRALRGQGPDRRRGGGARPRRRDRDDRHRDDDAAGGPPPARPQPDGDHHEPRGL